ncbi:MAG: helix-turn-helix transcriptional regulator [Myxococcales bacterium]|nr:helix-turn-helix transcriptional regulator [Polyangiaceae bacterium]MDW8248329.1 helix-turn-helix transcriptional regulator [Myxococcales bacterium]
MTPEDIKALRSELKCTARELANALGIEQSTVLAWEAGELFPTKKFCDQMEALRARGPGAIPRKAKGAQVSPMKVMSDPSLWELFRKLIAHKKLRDEVTKLAAAYPDPVEEGESSK